MQDSQSYRQPSLVATFGRGSAAFAELTERLMAHYKGLAKHPSVKHRFDEWHALAHDIVEAPDVAFVQQTYLSMLLRLLARRVLEPGAGLEGADEARKVLLGDYFQVNQRVYDLAEDDLFTWPLHPALDDAARTEGGDIAIALFDLLAAVDTGIDPQVVSALCADLLEGSWSVDSATLSGMEHTALIEQVGPSVLAPVSGLGVRLSEAVRMVREGMATRRDSPQVMLDHLRDNVGGLALEPVLLVAARLNYLLSLGDLKIGRHPAITLPVYMDLHNAGPTPSSDETVATFRFRSLPFPLEAPQAVLNDYVLAQRVAGAMYLYLDDYVVRSPDEDRFLSAFGSYLQGRKDIGPHLQLNDVGVLVGAMTALRRLYLPGRDLLFFTLLKHAVLSEALRRRRFDVILAGPAPRKHQSG